MKRVLITGAAGFIGSHVAERLLGRGDIVAGLDNFNDYYDPRIKRHNTEKALANGRYELHEIDICDAAIVRDVFTAFRPEVVVHLAARAGVRPSLDHPDVYHQVNVIGSQHILDACRAVDLSHLVFASSSSVYGGSRTVPFMEDNPVAYPISPYAATKRMGELMAHVYSHVYGLNVTLLRLFTVYGPRQRPDMAIHRFTRLMSAGEPAPMFGDGATARDYTYIDDIVDGLVSAIDRPLRYEIINLGGDRSTTLSELIALIARCLGKPATVEPLPMQPGDVEITWANLDKARRLLDYAPRVPIEQGVAAFVAWYREARK